MATKPKGGARPVVRPDDKRKQSHPHRGGGYVKGELKPISMVRLSPEVGERLAQLANFLRIHDADPTMSNQDVAERAIDALHLEYFGSKNGVTEQ